MQASAIRTAAANFHSCLESLWPLAAKRHISRASFDKYVGGLTPDLRIMDLVDAQPEFTKAFWDYLDILVNDARVANGREVLTKHKATFDAVEKAYGVDRYTITAIWGVGIIASGNSMSVTSNKLTNSGGGGVLFAGTQVTVSLNTILYAFSTGINGSGDDASVTSNKISFTFGDGILVSADNATISFNTVKHATDDADGIQLILNAAGGGTIEGNRVDDASGNGILLNSNNLTVRNNTVSRCGSENESGISITGNTNMFLSNTAVESDNVGFRVSGNQNTFDLCVSKDAGADGFRVLAGSDANVFDDCSATGSGGEGFDNRGTNTQLPSGTYLKNRIDIANDMIGGATILGGLTNVNFDTGGIGVQPEVD